ncbi:MAG: hypothetical protein ACLFUS_16365, partial [Candidatus Sumerlaeia bacterium]
NHETHEKPETGELFVVQPLFHTRKKASIGEKRRRQAGEPQISFPIALAVEICLTKTQDRYQYEGSRVAFIEAYRLLTFSALLFLMAR